MPMELQIFNSASRRKEIFKPIDKNRVTMYVCGPTVYNRVHIGNARPAVIFDTLFRLLKRLYPRVVYARNITDIDDKIIKASRELNQDISVITERYSRLYIQDMDSLNNLTPTFSPRATDHISEMLDIITDLVKSGFAYFSEGHVLFSVAADSNYGKLSQRLSSELMAGARINVASYKQNPGDFVLWKPSGPADPGWPSRWGRGRPGWHIECSSMVLNSIGNSVDIHGGGIDLIFPHHENEIAQSESLNGKKFADIWMHNGMVKIAGEKMSKSLGNLIKLKDAIELFGPDLLRMWILSSHYRKPLLYDEKVINSFVKPLKRIMEALDAKSIENENILNSDSEEKKFDKALSSDLNTSIALSQIILLAKKINTSKKTLNVSNALIVFKKMLEITGLCQKNEVKNKVINNEFDKLLQQRNEYRKFKEFAKADSIRKVLQDKGVNIIDNNDGTSSWEKI